MDTQSIKTGELTKAALRYAVAVAAGHSVSELMAVGNDVYANVQDERGLFLGEIAHGQFTIKPWQPDRDWSQLGPLIEQFEVLLGPEGDGWWSAECDVGYEAKHLEHFGKSLLVVICRAIAASHWGEYADIPSELVEQSDE